MKAPKTFTLAACVLCPVVIAAACAPSDFTSGDVLASVRVLGTRADFDEAYAKPGDVVTLESLAIDGRTNPAAPMTVYWLPFVCENPADDLYAACFAGGTLDGGISSTPVFVPADAGASDATVGSSLGSSTDGGTADAAVTGAASSPIATTPQAGNLGSILQPGTDLTPYLATGSRFTFDVPSDIISSHPTVAGAPFPYGLAILFNVACAGHVVFTGIDPSAGPQQVPLGCFDADGNALGPDDYVIGFTRIYAYADLPNANPTIAGVLFDGVEMATTADSTRPPGDAHDVPAAVDWTVSACGSRCKETSLTVDVPQSSWEVDPADKDTNGNPRHETLWVEWFATAGGSLDGDSTLLYDAVDGQITGAPAVNYTPPSQPGEAVIYAVVHDNRDGITWVQINVHAR